MEVEEDVFVTVGRVKEADLRANEKLSLTGVTREVIPGGSNGVESSSDESKGEPEISEDGVVDTPGGA